jgi:aspartyl-tRNA(Asn)/glutamyl-tRNA(Gln) amidotransferase subunit A
MRKEAAGGPLWGIPFAVKDIMDVAGLPTTAASKILADNVAASDAPVVELIRNSGAVILGKTNTQEFAYGVRTPPTANPWDVGRIPGGSSGGSAVALSASHCLGALGSDTAGSIRIPSALCGVTGLKPRPNTFPIGGVFPLALSFDVVGPMARNALDLALVCTALGSEMDWRRLQSGGLLDDGFRLALPYDGMLPQLYPEIEEAYANAVEVVRKIAKSTTEAENTVPQLEEFDRPRSLVLMVEALEVHRSRGWWPARAADYTDETRSYLEYAERTFKSSDGNTYPEYDASLQSCRELGARFSSFLEYADVLATPSVARPAPTLEEAARVGEGPRRPAVIELTRIPAAVNVAGLAGLSIPCGFTAEGLPIGLQLIGKDEALLVEIGVAYQRETDWHERRPPIAEG